jgi:hypothetical protein
MLVKTATLLGLLVLVATSGCIGADNKVPVPNPEDGSASHTANSTTSTADVPISRLPKQESSPQRLQLNDCFGLDTGHYAVSSLEGAKPPPQWGEGPTPITEVYIMAFNCERIAIGPFERGPVQFLIEVHGNREAPENCTTGDYTSSEVITQVWSNDLQIVEYFSTKLGLPAALGFMNFTTTTTGPRTAFNLTLEKPGGPPSWLETDTYGPADTNGTYLYRRFWVNERGGISYMDFETSYSRSSQASQIVTGLVRDPFLHVDGVERYVGTGNILGPSSVDAPIARFGDLECKEPY